MRKKKKDYKILKLACILFLVCAIVAGVLGGIYNLTEERISLQRREKTNRAFASVLPADDYEPVKYDRTLFPTIDDIEKATDGSGYVVQTTFSGAQGRITMVVGVSDESGDFRCTGISIINHTETSGLGAVAASKSERGQNFRASFIGKDDTIKFTDIDAITGATITSKAVTNAVSTVIHAVESVEGGKV